ncbi:DNA-binding transcriptional regulator, LysR family [Sporobacter termitidis DSM 10068]|uniref:DNA-binding transcriptional regulator, LysR family n=1 Tax=Sporobacter termitidis DSM 10068 TaxID=1123282 RepID=A0A1M5YGF7_9FIRM|nr:LysR family transcriptional regulator [Sporobacter termitidis]SHI11151.1 DNA-binding transcriptional regulator, LysR family [Sporobacter termitidis DSM 10068]
MDITQIRYFISVTETLNFRESARRLGVAQSSISRQIVDLEEKLGVALFTRSSRAVALTEEGRSFLPYARDMLRTADSAAFLMSQMSSGKGHLSIATVSTSAPVLIRCLDVFFKRYPDIAVDVILNNGREQLHAMREEKHDFHFAHAAMLPDDGRLDYLVTHADDLVVVVPKGHPLTKKPLPLDFAVLEKERFLVSYEAGYPLLYNHTLDVCRAHNYVPRNMSRFDKAESVLLAISAGLGFSILPSALPAQYFPNSVDIIPIADMDTHRTYIAAWPRRVTNPSAALFLEIVREVTGG